MQIWSFNNFSEIFFFQGGIIVQHTSKIKNQHFEFILDFL